MSAQRRFPGFIAFNFCACFTSTLKLRQTRHGESKEQTQLDKRSGGALTDTHKHAHMGVGIKFTWLHALEIWEAC